ncbi:MAG: tetratricopeptide repeat protein [Holosporales bacterium]
MRSRSLIWFLCLGGSLLTGLKLEASVSISSQQMEIASTQTQINDLISENQQQKLILKANQADVEALKKLALYYFQGLLAKQVAQKIPLQSWAVPWKVWLKDDLRFLDLLLLHDHEYVKKKTKLLRRIERKAQHNDPVAQYFMGRLFQVGHFGAADTPMNQQAAYNWYALAAAQGLASAKYRMARAFERGQGVAADHEKALKFYEQLMASHHVHATFHAGFRLAHRVAQSPAEKRANDLLALSYYKKAAKAGSPAAQYHAAAMYEAGLCPYPGNVNGNLRRAYKFYQKAAVRNHKAACAKLGLIYWQGFPGVSAHTPRALEYALKSQEGRLINAMLRKRRNHDLAAQDASFDALRERVGALLGEISLQMLQHEPGQHPRDDMKEKRWPMQAVRKMYQPLEALLQQAFEVITFLEQNDVLVDLLTETQNFKLPRHKGASTPFSMVHEFKLAKNGTHSYLTIGPENVEKAQKVYDFFYKQEDIWRSADHVLAILRKAVSKNLAGAMADHLRADLDYTFGGLPFDIQQMQGLAQRMDYWKSLDEDLVYLENLRESMLKGFESHTKVRNKHFADHHPWVADF